MKTNISRRDFVKIGAKGLLGGMILYGASSLLRSFMPPGGANHSRAARYLTEYDLEKHYWGFVCDNEKCIGCGRCVVACKRENKVPWEPEYNRTWVERYIVTEDGEILVDSPDAGINGFAAEPLNTKYPNLDIRKSFFVPKLCNQCDNPPCVTVCPVGATYITDDGVILIDREHCIGCKYCIQACPYGARFLLPEERVIDKCTWCYHRIARGLVPACVEVCPVGARVFGDLRDPESPVQRVLTEKRIYVLKPDLGTEPKVYYIGFEKGVH
jgi:Fe-S-cluster-containing dehydrogenase component